MRQVPHVRWDVPDNVEDVPYLMRLNPNHLWDVPNFVWEMSKPKNREKMGFLSEIGLQDISGDMWRRQRR